MASLTRFDELNILTNHKDKKELIEREIRTYFEVMDLDDDEIEKRILLALDLEETFEDFLVVFMAMMAVDKDMQKEVQFLYEYLERKFIDVMDKHGYSDDEEDDLDEESKISGYLGYYVAKTVRDTVDTTILKKADNYYTSLGRAIVLAETEANSLSNYQREQEAIKNGCKYKTWVTKMDAKVRHTHKLVNMETIGIFDAFDVGAYKMMFPLDKSLGASAREIVNCRCVCMYTK